MKKILFFLSLIIVLMKICSSSYAFTITVTNPGTGTGTVYWKTMQGGVTLESCVPSAAGCQLGVSQLPISGNILEGVADSGSFFAGWSNSNNLGNVCTGTGVCTLGIMPGDGSVTATLTACTINIDPQQTAFTYSGGAGNIAVITNNSSCNWTATESLSWVTITSGSSGTGDGIIQYTASQNLTSAARNGVISIADKTFNITQQASPIKINVSPDSIAFGAQKTGELVESNISISNGGSSTLNITSIELMGSSDFSRSTSCSPLSPGSSCKAVVGFKPTSIGAKNATLVINSDDPVLPIYNVQLTGTGSDTATASISVSPSEINIPYVDIEIGDSKNIVISNQGTASLVINSIYVKGENASEFSVNNNCSIISAGSNCSFSLQGNYSIMESKQAVIVISSNAANSPKLEIPITASSTYCIDWVFSLSNTSTTVSSAATNGTVDVTATGSGSCVWNVKGGPSWISVSKVDYSVTYGVLQNDTGGLRRGIISIAGQPFTVIQNSGAGNTVFSDTSDTIFEDYINAIYTEGITVGCGQQGGNVYFCPTNYVTRGEMAAFIIRALFGETFNFNQTPYFSDVPENSVFFKYVQKLKEKGITVLENTYFLNNDVTRGEMAAFIIRALFGEDFDYTQDPYFSDVPQNNVFFKYVQKMKDMGITVLEGIYYVGNHITRGEMAAFLARGFLGMK